MQVSQQQDNPNNKVNNTPNKRRQLGLCGLLLLALSPSTFAAPQVIVNPTAPASTTAATAAPPTQNPNQPTLAQLNQPSTQALQQANEQLLITNAELKRQVDSLATQVNVLVHERSGQLFVYGAVTALFGVLVGLALGWLVFGRKGRW